MAHITQFPNEVKDLILKHIFRNLTMVLRHDIKRNLDFGVPTLISIRRNLFTRQTVTEAILQHSIIKIEDDAAFEHLSATISPTQRMRVRRILTDVPITSNSTFSTFANVFPNVELLTCTQCYGTDASFETPSRSAAYLPNGLIDLASEYDSEGNTRTRRCRRESVALFDPLRCALEVEIDTKTLGLSSIVHTELLKITDRFPAVWKKQILRATAEHTRLEMNFDLRLCDNQWSQREIICSCRFSTEDNMLRIKIGGGDIRVLQAFPQNEGINEMDFNDETTADEGIDDEDVDDEEPSRIMILIIDADMTKYRRESLV